MKKIMLALLAFLTSANYCPANESDELNPYGNYRNYSRMDEEAGQFKNQGLTVVDCVGCTTLSIQCCYACVVLAFVCALVPFTIYTIIETNGFAGYDGPWGIP